MRAEGGVASKSFTRKGKEGEHISVRGPDEGEWVPWGASLA